MSLPDLPAAVSELLERVLARVDIFINKLA